MTRRFPGRTSAAVISNEGERFAKVKLGAIIEGDFESLGIEFVRHAGEKIGLESPRNWPCEQPSTISQPTGSADGDRSALRVPFRQRELGEGDERERYGERAEVAVFHRVGGLDEQSSRLVEITNPQGKRGELCSRGGRQPIVADGRARVDLRTAGRRWWPPSEARRSWLPAPALDQVPVS